MFKKVISVILTVALLVSCFSMAVSARQIGVGRGAESFNPVVFSQESDDVGDTTVNTNLVAKITNNNYQIKINSISALMPYYSESGSAVLNVAYTAGTVVSDETKFAVTGTIETSTNSAVRYTVTYDILSKSGKTVWKNLTGYAYGKVAGSDAVTGAIGSEPGMPGDIRSGTRFTSLEKLNSCYVQVPSESLEYELKAQHFLIAFSSTTTVVGVTSGNAPSTLSTGSVYWPATQWYLQEESGTWLSWTEPDSGYYNFTVDMNSNNQDWDDESNTVVSTEMYYLKDSDRAAALAAAELPLALNESFGRGYYVQKGKYTEESWNNFITALDTAFHVAYAVPGANYGFRLACVNGTYADDNLANAFANLQEAECDWTTYKDAEISDQPTCNGAGAKVYTCICGKTKTETISSAGCQPSDEWTMTTEPTCTTKGEEVQFCTVCNNPVNTREIEALGHEYISSVTEPTCLDEGYNTYTCIRGDHTYNDDFVPANGHTPGRIDTIDATAVRDGLKTVYCADCNTLLSRDIVGKPEGKVVFSTQSNGRTILTGVVSSDYSATVTVPKGSIINAGEVTGSLSMTDIASLGINGTRTYEKTITTGVEKEVLLDNYMPAFSEATISGTIDGNDYFYNVLATDTEESYTIEAVPENEEDARKAFQALTSHVTSATKTEDDSYAEIPGTAYMQIGTEKLSFENTDETLRLDNIEQGSGLKAQIRSAVKLEEAEELEDAQIEIFIPAGTVLSVGQSIVTLNDHAIIKMYGYDDNDTVNTILSTLRDCQTNEEIIVAAVLFISDFAMAIDGNDLVLNVDFKVPGVEVSGTVESFIFEEETTIELLLDGEVIQSISVDGSGIQDYAFECVPDGEYILRVSKSNHATREYEIVVAGEAITAELKIHLLGDIDGNGKVNILDTARANAHSKNVNILEGYSVLCCDINKDGKVNMVDVARINAHSRSVSTLW